MKLVVPFIKSRGGECGQTCMAMMIKYFIPDFQPDFDEINQIIHHEKGFYTFPPQDAILLHHFGIRAKAFSSENYPTTDEEPGVFGRWFGTELNAQMKYVNPDSYNWMCREIRKLNLLEIRKTSIDDMLTMVGSGYLVHFVLDWNRLKHRTGVYQGHGVLITGFEDNKVFIHDPDEGPYIEYPKETLAFAYSHPTVTEDLVVAYGKSASMILSPDSVNIITLIRR